MAFAVRLSAQTPAAAVPFSVGEELVFRATFGKLPAGTAKMRVDGIDTVLYAVRVAGVRVGETRRDDRYFRPDRNPVVLTGLREDTVNVGAGTFATIVVRPSIKSGGIFSENGEAQVWFTNDERRLPVQVKTKFAKFSLTLSLQSVSTALLADSSR
jgi:hypothetical protein